MIKSFDLMMPLELSLKDCAALADPDPVQYTHVHCSFNPGKKKKRLVAILIVIAPMISGDQQ